MPWALDEFVGPFDGFLAKFELSRGGTDQATEQLYIWRLPADAVKRSNLCIRRDISV
jgi:hypothetical protein